MNDIKLTSIKHNYLSNDFVFLDNQFILYFPYTSITNEKKNLLLDIHFPVVFTNGQFINPLEPNTLYTNSLDNSYDLIASQKEMATKYNIFLDKFMSLMQSLTTKQQFKFKAINDFLYEEVYPAVQKSPFSYLNILDYQKKNIPLNILPYHWSLQHMLFTLSLSEASHNKLIVSANRRIEISIAMLLLNIGFLPIINQLEKENKPLQFSYRNPKLSVVLLKMYEQIFKKSYVPQLITNIVYNTHKLFVNPRTPLSETDSINANYCFLISTYLYLVSNTPQNKPIMPSQALPYLIKQSKPTLNLSVLKNVSETLGLIPIGTYVELTNGTKGIIIKQDSKHPKHPLIQVLVTTSGTPNTTPTVLPTTEKDFHLKSIIPPKEIPMLKKIKKEIINNI